MPNNDKSALLIMDLQNGIASRFPEEELLPFQKRSKLHARRISRLFMCELRFAKVTLRLTRATIWQQEFRNMVA